MKKRAAILTALVLAVMMVFTACSGGAEGNGDASGETADLVMATGGTAGTYYPYGGAVAKVLEDGVEGLSVSVQSTGASAANLRLLNEGDAEIAIVQNDVMDYAYNGTEVFKDNAVDGFSTMATVYAEVCQIVADPDSGIETIADLKGKRVSVGDAGSGVEANSKQILEAYGITFEDIKMQNLSFADSAAAIKDKKIDAFFCTAGLPTTAIIDLSSTNDIKVISVDGEEAASLIEKYPFYTSYTIPKDEYKGMTEDVETLAVKATLIVSPDLSEELVYNMTKALFEGKEEIAISHDKGNELDVNEAVKGVSVPFHPGALKYYKELGLINE